MLESRLTLKLSAVAGLFTLLLPGCTGETPPNAIPAPDLDLITVFYPKNGIVFGRGAPGSVAGNLPFVRIKSLPSSGETFQRVNPDGSFTFDVIAIGGDLIELASSSDDKGAGTIGASSYVVVPPAVLPPPEQFCCFGESDTLGKCLAVDSLNPNEPIAAQCPALDNPAGTECTTDQQCGIDARQYIDINLDDVNVSAPDFEGRVNVSGTIVPNALLTIENRGKAGVQGEVAHSWRRVLLTEPDGSFSFRAEARGDDELVFQGEDLNGFFTPQAAMLVPDSQLDGLDILGAVAYSRLTPGEPGDIALLFMPYGQDGFGMCPDHSSTETQICLSGGLRHQDLSIENWVIEGNAVASATPIATPTSEGIPYNVGIEGQDPFGGGNDVVLVIDMSKWAATNDVDNKRIDAAIRFVNALRSRDRISLTTFGGDPMPPTQFPNLVQDAPDPRPSIVAQLGNLRTLTPDGKGEVLVGIREAVAKLRERGGTVRARRRGRIFVLSTTDHEGSSMEAADLHDELYPLVIPDPATAFDGYAIDHYAIEAKSHMNENEVSFLASFSNGRYIETVKSEVGALLAERALQISGAFALLYRVDIPTDICKVRTLRFVARVNFDYQSPPDKEISPNFEGIIDIANQGQGPQVSCPLD